MLRIPRVGLCTFEKHVYAEVSKQLNKAHWQQNCNENSQRIEKKNKLEWGQKKKTNYGVDLITQWKDCNKYDAKE